MISAGRVLIKPCGEWKADVTYYMLDLVNHNGYAYLAKRTVVGIEPSNDYPEYWHNMLDINKVVEDAISGTLADDVGKLLEERFAELLSEARYVTDLFADFDVPTFVRWDTYTANTPYTAGLTTCYEGFALVFGKYATNHTISAWAKGGLKNECFTHTVSDGKVIGWDKTISASGGTMTGPLGLGGGKGSVSADEEGTFIQASKNDDEFTRLEVVNPSKEGASLEESAKIVEKKDGALSKFNLFGEHNMDLMSSLGMARIESGSYVGKGSCGVNNPNSLSFSFVPKIVFICNGSKTEPLVVMINGASLAMDLHADAWEGAAIHLNWEEKTLSWYVNASADYAETYQFNYKNTTYLYVAIG